MPVKRKLTEPAFISTGLRRRRPPKFEAVSGGRVGGRVYKSRVYTPKTRFGKLARTYWRGFRSKAYRAFTNPELRSAVLKAGKTASAAALAGAVSYEATKKLDNMKKSSSQRLYTTKKPRYFLPGDTKPKQKKPRAIPKSRPLMIPVSGEQPSAVGQRMMVPLRLSNSNTRGLRNSKEGKQIRTVINLGKPLSRHWRMRATIDGISNFVCHDTLTDYSTSVLGGLSDKRRLLTVSHGFNRRVCMCPDYQAVPRVTVALNGNASTNVGSNFNGIGENLTQGNFGSRKVYAGIIGTNATHTFTNTSNVVSAYMRVTVFYPLDPEVNATRILDKVFGNPSGTQQRQAIPQRYLLEDTNNAISGTNAGVVSVDPTTNLASSAYWRKNIRIAHRRTVKLSPNDVWTLKINETYHDGVDLMQCTYLMDDTTEVEGSFQQQTLLSYGLLFEQWGPKVDAIQFTNDNGDVSGRQTFIGTSSGTISREHKLSYKMVNPATTIDPDTGFVQSVEGTGYAIKVRANIPRLAVVFNTPVANIGRPGEAGKDLYIPIETDTVTRYVDTQEDNTSGGD